MGKKIPVLFDDLGSPYVKRFGPIFNLEGARIAPPWNPPYTFEAPTERKAMAAEANSPARKLYGQPLNHYTQQMYVVDHVRRMRGFGGGAIGVPVVWSDGTEATVYVKGSSWVEVSND